jgi:alginate O-acetyltransferase complex protein AlgI
MLRYFLKQSNEASQLVNSLNDACPNSFSMFVAFAPICMLFHTSTFLVFFLTVFALHWWVLKREVKWQNALLLASSYFFYGCWDWRFVALLVFSTLLDFITGIKIGDSKSERARKIWLWTSVGINVGLLGVFKYYDFFALSFAEAVGHFGWKVDVVTLQLILPVGISFYTFHGLSYVLDIYHRRIEPDRNLVDYALFVSYFPLLVAGPIERATHLLPQLKRARQFNSAQAVEGLRIFLWGLVKKVLIADNCGIIADAIYADPTQWNAPTLWLGVAMFTIQVYGDFSGYSDMAQGVSRIFGIELIRNFNYPYFATSIAEYWKRWHLSLTGWFRDYVYFPLGGSRGSKWKQARNIFIIFLLSGFWHGANWNYVGWGFVNACYFIPGIIRGKREVWYQKYLTNGLLGRVLELALIVSTFIQIMLSLVVFRNTSISNMLVYMRNMFVGAWESIPGEKLIGFNKTILLVGFFFLVEWFSRHKEHPFAQLHDKFSRPIRWVIYYIVLILLAWFAGHQQQFIYFQF